MRFIKLAIFLSFFFALAATNICAQSPLNDVPPLFPDVLGDFKRVSLPRPVTAGEVLTDLDQSSYLGATAEYKNSRGATLKVQIVRFHQDADAYSTLTLNAAAERSKGSPVQLDSQFGTASFTGPRDLYFFKGLNFVRVSPAIAGHDDGLGNVARLLSDTLDKGEAEVPALVKHLPDYEQTQKQAIFLNRFATVKNLAPAQTVLDVVATDRDADAVFAETYKGKVLIIEYHTPQLAKENDERVIAKIQELWKLGQPAPIGYQRKGNYSVFVFDAPNELAAKDLIAQVHYEQVIQWLGQNPNLYREAERQYVETTLGVFIAVLKASGYALVACLGLGGVLGALLFNRRRTQQRTHEAYSDAGGMLRLNIDELTPQTDPARLLGPGQ